MKTPSSPSPVTVERACELTRVWNNDAPDGMAYACPDCVYWATLGGNAGFHMKETGHGVPVLLPLPTIVAGKKDAVSATTVQAKEASGEPGDVAANTVPSQMALQEESEDQARDFASKANICTHAGICSLALPVFMELNRWKKLCHIQHRFGCEPSSPKATESADVGREVPFHHADECEWMNCPLHDVPSGLKEAASDNVKTTGQKALDLLATFDADAWFGRPGDVDCQVAGDPNGSSPEDFYVLCNRLDNMKQRAQDFWEDAQRLLSEHGGQPESASGVSSRVSEFERTCIHHSDHERAVAWDFKDVPGCPVCAMVASASVEHVEQEKWIQAQSVGCEREIRTVSDKWIGYGLNREDAAQIVEKHNASIERAVKQQREKSLGK